MKLNAFYFLSIQTLALNWNSTYQIQQSMVFVNKKVRKEDEKEWENPVNPEMTSDDRDKEQLLRQYKEAKRRKDNLTQENQTDNKTS